METEEREDRYELYEKLHIISLRLLNNSKSNKRITAIYDFKKCSGCSSFNTVLLEDLAYRAKCSYFDKFLSHKNPVTECNCYNEKAALHFADVEMATLINTKDKKSISIGFNRKEKDNDR
jgi:hypothetical protein